MGDDDKKDKSKESFETRADLLGRINRTLQENYLGKDMTPEGAKVISIRHFKCEMGVEELKEVIAKAGAESYSKEFESAGDLHRVQGNLVDGDDFVYISGAAICHTTPEASIAQRSMNLARALVRNTAEKECLVYGKNAFTNDKETEEVRVDLEMLFAETSEYKSFSEYVNVVGMYVERGLITPSLARTYIDSACESMNYTRNGFTLNWDVMTTDLQDLCRRAEINTDFDTADNEGHKKHKIRGHRGPSYADSPKPLRKEKGRAIPAYKKHTKDKDHN